MRDAGLSFLSEDEWTVDARRQGAPASAGSFSSGTPPPNLLGNLLVGLQVFPAQGREPNLQYSPQTGAHHDGQSVSGRAAYRF
jgi:hypothetical protein